jgi:hypothetical protein
MRANPYRVALLIAGLIVTPLGAAAQSLSPPNAEYRVKANGMLELRNDSAVPQLAVLQVQGFSLDDHGNVIFQPLDSAIQVDLGASSFVIPPHQSHYVFYRATSTRLPAWFAIVNNLTQANPVRQGLRVNIVLPHFVYIYQKQRVGPKDLEVKVYPGDQRGEYRLEIKNLSEKMGRVAFIQANGFEEKASLGGFPILPEETRQLTLKAGPPVRRAEFRVRLADGYHFKVPYLPPEPSQPSLERSSKP